MTNIVWSIWLLLNAAAKAMCMWYIFTKKLRHDGAIRYILLISAALGAITMLAADYRGLPFLLTLCIIFAEDLLTGIIFCKNKFRECALMSVMHVYILCVANAVSVTVISVSPDKLALSTLPGATGYLVTGANTLLCAAFTLLFVKITHNRAINPSISKWMTVFAAIGVVAMYYMTSGRNTDSNAISVLVSFAVLAVVVVIPFVFILLNSSVERESKAEAERAALSQELKYLEQLSSLATKVREIKHDYANHMSVMVNLADKGDTDELLRYILSYKNEYGVVDAYAITGNIPLDSLLSAKLIICREHGIEVDCRIFKWGETSLTSEELCSLFGNLFDNAIAGARTVREGSRYITIKTQRVSSMLNITIENSYDENGEREPREGEHGFGLPRVRSIAENHAGVCTISCDGTRFEVDILLPLRS